LDTQIALCDHFHHMYIKDVSASHTSFLRPFINLTMTLALVN
jgi:hypothetical protein